MAKIMMMIRTHSARRTDFVIMLPFPADDFIWIYYTEKGGSFKHVNFRRNASGPRQPFCPLLFCLSSVYFEKKGE